MTDFAAKGKTTGYALKTVHCLQGASMGIAMQTWEKTRSPVLTIAVLAIVEMACAILLQSRHYHVSLTVTAEMAPAIQVKTVGNVPPTAQPYPSVATTHVSTEKILFYAPQTAAMDSAAMACVNLASKLHSPANPIVTVAMDRAIPVKTNGLAPLTAAYSRCVETWYANTAKTQATAHKTVVRDSVAMAGVIPAKILGTANPTVAAEMAPAISLKIPGTAQGTALRLLRVATRSANRTKTPSCAPKTAVRAIAAI